MFSTITSAMISGVEPVFIHVEVDIAHGLPGFMLVGYLSGEVKEAGERVRVALKNTGIVLPPMRITVNLSPAGMRKEGTAFDLPIAVGILKALGHLPGDSTEGMLVIGELGLSGRVNPVRGVLPLVKKAKEEGVRVTAETTPHHLCLTDEAVRGYDTNTKVNPPLRTEADRQAVFQGLKQGIIDCISTDHAPHTAQEKEVEYIYAANGISGLETAVPLVWSNFVMKGQLTPLEMVRAMSKRPAEILGIERGTLMQGAVADITILDPKTEKAVDKRKFYSKGKNTPFAGQQLCGWPVMVLKNGRIVLENGVLCEKE